MEIFDNIINNYTNGSITTTIVFSVLLMTLLLAVYEFTVYRYISHRTFYNKQFNITITVIPFFIATIVLSLQSNVIMTFGTIGALAILRFRTSVKDPVDMLYLLWSVYIGIVCGCQLYEVAVLTSIIVTIVLFGLENITFGRKPFVLILHSNDDIEKELNEALNSKKINNKFKSRNYTEKGYDYAIEFTTKDIEILKKILEGNNKINKYSIVEYDADDIV